MDLDSWLTQYVSVRYSLAALPSTTLALPVQTAKHVVTTIRMLLTSARHGGDSGGGNGGDDRLLPATEPTPAHQASTDTAAAAAAALQAYRLLASTVYEARAHGFTGQGTAGSAIASFPSFSPTIPDTVCKPYYNTSAVAEAWRLLISAGNALGGNQGYEYDLVAVGTTVGSNLFYATLQEFKTAFNAAPKDKAKLKAVGAKLIGIVKEVDALLLTSPSHLFGTYLRSAETSGTTVAEVDLFRAAAKRLVTVWGYPMANGTAVEKTHSSNLSEYAYRLWAGLVSSYHLPRWQMWIANIMDAVAYDDGDNGAGSGSDSGGGGAGGGAGGGGGGNSRDRGSVRGVRDFTQDLMAWELAWIANSSITSTSIGIAPQGSALRVAKELLARWGV